MDDIITFQVLNPGSDDTWHYAVFNGKVYGGWASRQEVLDEISQDAVSVEALWKTTTYKNPTKYISTPCTPVPGAEPSNLTTASAVSPAKENPNAKQDEED